MWNKIQIVFVKQALFIVISNKIKYFYGGFEPHNAVDTISTNLSVNKQNTLEDLKLMTLLV